MTHTTISRRQAMAAGGSMLLASAFASEYIGAAQPAKKILYFTKSSGFEHSVVRRKGDSLAHSEKILIAMGKQHGFEVTASKDGRIFDGEHEKYDGYVFYTSGDLTKVGKDKGPAMSKRGKQALLDAVRKGKGFIGLHSATDSFHSPGKRQETQAERDPYIEMIGGEFVSHGKQQEATMRVADSDFPAFDKLGKEYRLLDEWYALKNCADDLHVLLVNETEGMEGPVYQRPAFPATWARPHGKGRVFYTSMGHREDVWTHPIFQSVLIAALRWTTGLIDASIPPNLEHAAPGAGKLPG